MWVCEEGKYGDSYNILIMEEKQTIVACGAGAYQSEFIQMERIERSEQCEGCSQYIERIGK